LFEKMPRVSSIRFPSSRVHLQRHARAQRWVRRSSAACPMRWLMVCNG
jgi:hypothetical protein